MRRGDPYAAQKERRMKAILLTVALLLSGADTAQAPPPSPSGNFRKGMKQYFMGFLVRGEKNGEPIAKDELSALQQQHLAYIRSQAEAGKYALAGPKWSLIQGPLRDGTISWLRAPRSHDENTVEGQHHGGPGRSHSNDHQALRDRRGGREETV